MKTVAATKALALAALAALPAARAEEADPAALLRALPKAKTTLAQGIAHAAQAPAVPISAKFELDDLGQLSLSVYTAAKGVGGEAEHVALQELSGSPESGTWSPEVETFSDPEHVARASGQQTLMSLTRLSLLEVVRKAAQHGTVFSVTPEVRNRKPVFAVLVASKEKAHEITYDLVTGAEAKGKTSASAR